MVCAFDMSLSVEGSLCRKCSSPSATTMCQDHLEYVEGAEDRRVTFTRQNPGPELKVEGSRGSCRSHSLPSLSPCRRLVYMFLASIVL